MSGPIRVGAADAYLEMLGGDRFGPYSLSFEIQPSDWSMCAKPLRWVNRTGRTVTITAVVVFAPVGIHRFEVAPPVNVGPRDTAIVENISFEIHLDHPADEEALRRAYLGGALSTEEFIEQMGGPDMGLPKRGGR